MRLLISIFKCYNQYSNLCKKDIFMKSVIKRTVAVLMLLVITASMLASCTVEKAYPGAPDGMRPCNIGEQGVIMYVPANWSVDTSTKIPTAFFSNTEQSMITLVTVPNAEWKAGDANKTIPQYWSEQKVKFDAMTELEFNVIKPSTEATDDLYFTDVIAENKQIFEYRYSFKLSSQGADLKYCFSQAFVENPVTADLYIITYSALDTYFDTHLEDISKIYENLKFVTETEPMADSTPDSSFVSVPDTPEGYSAITGEHVDYILFVPADWTPLLNTGITAASAPNAPSVTCSVTGFNLENNDRVIDPSDFDNYFSALEATIVDTFGNISFDDVNAKYIPTTIGVTGTDATLDARKYVYRVAVNGVEYTYDQYIVIFQGYVYQITFCCKTVDYAAYSPVFDGIATSFKIKG